MGTLEANARKKARRRSIQRAMLTAAKTGLLIGIAMTAPNVIGAMKKIGIVDFDSADASSIARARTRMLRTGLLEKNRQGFLCLSEKGRLQLRRMVERERVQEKPRKWDKRWRVLIFDIPEYRKSTRVKLRRTLHTVGFMRLQDSVWIYPYDCENFVALLKADFKIGKDVLYMIVDEVENDARIRAQFGLR